MKKPGDFALRLLGLFSGVAIISAVTVFFLVDHSRRDLEAYRTALITKGERLTVEGLRPPVPTEEGNGARELVKTARELNQLVKEQEIRRITIGQATGKTPGVVPVFHQRPTAQVNTVRNPKVAVEEVSWEQAKTEQEIAAPLLEKIREIAKAPRLELQPDYSLGLAMPMDGLSALPGSAQFLAQQSLLQIHEGKIGSAIENVIAIIRLADMVARQQSMMSQAVSLSMQRMACNVTWEILQAKETTPADLFLLQSLWEKTAPTAYLKPSLRMERAAARSLFDEGEEAIKAASGGGSSSGSPSFDLGDLEGLATTSAWALFYRYDDEREYLEDYQAILDQIPETGENWRPFLVTTREISKRLSHAGLSRMLSSTMAYVALTNMERFPLTITVRKLCLTAIAIRRYQLDHANTAPSSLADLVPKYLSAVPLDPMDGKPLRYSTNGAGDYTLYSVGKDGVDDGGNAASPPSPSGNPTLDFANRIDIVWPQAEKP